MIWSAFEYLFVPIQLPAESVVSNMTATKQESCLHRKRLGTLHYATSPLYLLNPSTNIRHQADATLFASMEQIDCTPRRAQDFHASREGLGMTMKINISHAQEDSVYCAAWKIGGHTHKPSEHVCEPRGHAREPQLFS